MASGCEPLQKRCFVDPLRAGMRMVRNIACVSYPGPPRYRRHKRPVHVLVKDGQDGWNHERKLRPMGRSFFVFVKEPMGHGDDG